MFLTDHEMKTILFKNLLSNVLALTFFSGPFYVIKLPITQGNINVFSSKQNDWPMPNQHLDLMSHKTKRLAINIDMIKVYTKSIQL